MTFTFVGIVKDFLIKYYKKIDIKKINKRYRKIDKETDVLSFPMFEKQELEEMIKNIDLAKKTAKNGYDLVNSKYTLEEISNVLEKAVQNAINRKKWI